MYPFLRGGVLCLALLWLPESLFAAPAKPSHATKAAGKRAGKHTPVLKGRLIRTLPARVTVFYSFKDKKTGKLHPMATVSKTVMVKVVKPGKRK